MMCDGDTWKRLDDDFAAIIGRMEVVAVSTGEEPVPTASAHAGRGRAHHDAGEKGGVVDLEEWRSSRAVGWGAEPARLRDDDHRVRGYPDSRKLVAPARLRAVRPKW